MAIDCNKKVDAVIGLLAASDPKFMEQVSDLSTQIRILEESTQYPQVVGTIRDKQLQLDAIVNFKLLSEQDSLVSTQGLIKQLRSRGLGDQIDIASGLLEKGPINSIDDLGEYAPLMNDLGLDPDSLQKITDEVVAGMHQKLANDNYLQQLFGFTKKQSYESLITQLDSFKASDGYYAALVENKESFSRYLVAREFITPQARPSFKSIANKIEGGVTGVLDETYIASISTIDELKDAIFFGIGDIAASKKTYDAMVAKAVEITSGAKGKAGDIHYALERLGSYNMGNLDVNKYSNRHRFRRAEKIGYRFTDINKAVDQLRSLVGGESSVKISIEDGEKVFTQSDLPTAIAILGIEDSIQLSDSFSSLGKRLVASGAISKSDWTVIKGQIDQGLLDEESMKVVLYGVLKQNVAPTVNRQQQILEDLTGVTLKVEDGSVKNAVFFDPGDKIPAPTGDGLTSKKLYDSIVSEQSVEIGSIAKADTVTDIPAPDAEDVIYIVVPDRGYYRNKDFAAFLNANRDKYIVVAPEKKMLSRVFVDDGKLRVGSIDKAFLENDIASIYKDVGVYISTSRYAGSDLLKKAYLEARHGDKSSGITKMVKGDIYGMNKREDDIVEVTGKYYENYANLLEEYNKLPGGGAFYDNEAQRLAGELGYSITGDAPSNVKDLYFDYKYAPTVEAKQANLVALLEGYGLQGLPGPDGSGVAIEYMKRMRDDAFGIPAAGLSTFLKSIPTGSIDEDFLQSFIVRNKERLDRTGGNSEKRAREYLTRLYDEVSVLGKPTVGRSPVPKDGGISAFIDEIPYEYIVSAEAANQGYFKAKGHITKTNINQAIKSYTSVINDYRGKLKDAIDSGMSYNELISIKRSAQRAIQDLEDTILLGDLLKSIPPEDRNAFIGSKFSIFEYTSKQEIGIIDDAMDNVIEDFARKMDRLGGTIQAAKKGDYASTGMVKAGDGSLVNVDVAIISEINRATDTIGPIKAVQAGDLRNMSRADKAGLYDKLRSYNIGYDQTNGVARRVYEKIRPRLAQFNFFDSYKLLQVSGGTLPKPVLDFNVGLGTDILIHPQVETEMKVQLFKQISDRIKDGKMSMSYIDNLESFSKMSRDVVSKNLNDIPADADLDILTSALLQPFAPYADLIPLPKKTINSIQKKVNKLDAGDGFFAVPEARRADGGIEADYLFQQEDLVIKRPTEYLDEYGESLQESLDKSVKQLELDLDQYDESVAKLRADFAFTARGQLEKTITGKALMSANESVSEFGKKAGGKLSFLSGPWREVLKKTLLNIDVTGIGRSKFSKQSEQVIKGAQDVYLDMLNASDAEFKGIASSSRTSAEDLAFEVARYFREFRTASRTSIDGAGPFFDAAENIRLHNMGEEFMNISNRTHALRFSGALSNGEFLYALSRNKESIFHEASKITGEIDFLTSGIKQSKIDEINRIFKSDYDLEEGSAIILGTTGNRAADMQSRILGLVENAARISPLPKIATLFPMTVFGAIAGLPSYFGKFTGLMKANGITSTAGATKLRSTYNVLSESAELSISAFVEIAEAGLQAAGIRDGDTWITTMTKIIDASSRELFTGKIGEATGQFLTNANNLIDILTAARGKDIAFMKAVKDNGIKKFASLDEFRTFMDSDTVPQQMKDKVLSRIRGDAAKNYYGFMGIEFGSTYTNSQGRTALTEAIRRATGSGSGVGIQILNAPLMILAKAQSYLGGRAYNNIKGLANLMGAFTRSAWAVTSGQASVSDFFQLIRQTPEYQNGIASLMGEVFNSVRVAKYLRNAEGGDELEDANNPYALSASDIFDGLTLMSQNAQSFQLFGTTRPFAGAVETYIDYKEGNTEDKGLGAFTALFMKSFYREMRATNFVTIGAGILRTQGSDAAMDYFMTNFPKLSDGSIRFMLGSPEYTGGISLYSSSPSKGNNLLVGEGLGNFESQFFFRQRGEQIYRAIKDKSISFGSVVLDLLKSSEPGKFVRGAQSIIEGEYRYSTNQLLEDVKNTPVIMQYMETGSVPIEGRDELIALGKSYFIFDAPGGGSFTDMLDFLLEKETVSKSDKKGIGNYLKYSDPELNSLLQSIPKDTLSERSDSLKDIDGNSIVARRRTMGINFLKDWANANSDNVLYPERATAIARAQLNSGYQAASKDGDTELEKEQSAAEYVKNNLGLMRGVTEGPYFNFIINSKAADSNPEMAKYMSEDDDGNPEYIETQYFKYLEKVQEAREEVLAGNFKEARVIFSPLVGFKGFNADEPETRAAAVASFTSTMKFIQDTPHLDSEEKSRAIQELVGNNIILVNAAIEELIEGGYGGEIGDSIQDMYNDYRDVLGNANDAMSDALNEASQNGGKSYKGNSVDIPKLTGLKSTISDLYDAAAIKPIKFGTNRSDWSIEPIITQQKKNNIASIGGAPKYSASSDVLQGFKLQSVTKKDIKRKIKAPKRKAFKAPK